MTIFSLQDGVSPGLPAGLTGRYSSLSIPQHGGGEAFQEQARILQENPDWAKNSLWNCYIQMKVLRKQHKTQGEWRFSHPNHAPRGQGCRVEHTEGRFGFFWFFFFQFSNPTYLSKFSSNVVFHKKAFMLTYPKHLSCYTAVPDYKCLSSKKTSYSSL